jgi:hypothetical protein
MVFPTARRVKHRKSSFEREPLDHGATAAAAAARESFPSLSLKLAATTFSELSKVAQPTCRTARSALSRSLLSVEGSLVSLP